MQEAEAETHSDGNLPGLIGGWVGLVTGDRLWKGQEAVAAKDFQQVSSSLRFLKHDPQGLAACLS